MYGITVTVFYSIIVSSLTDFFNKFFLNSFKKENYTFQCKFEFKFSCLHVLVETSAFVSANAIYVQVCFINSIYILFFSNNTSTQYSKDFLQLI